MLQRLARNKNISFIFVRSFSVKERWTNTLAYIFFHSFSIIEKSPWKPFID
jgi:hypothetical protein